MENVHSYVEHKEKYSKKLRAKGLKEAVDDCEKYIEKLGEQARRIIDEKETEIKETLTLIVSESGNKEENMKMRAKIALLENRNAALSNINSDSEVQDIVGRKKRKGKELFLIQWKNSWLPVESLNCASKLSKYRKMNDC